jgi:hypothetical protein
VRFFIIFTSCSNSNLLVDDASEREFLKRPLEEALAALPIPTFVLRHNTMNMSECTGFRKILQWHAAAKNCAIIAQRRNFGIMPDIGYLLYSICRI